MMNIAVVNNHRQVSPYSCIPMAIELVLKLLGRVPADYYDLQRAVGERRDVGFGEYSGREIAGIRFAGEFQLNRGAGFPIEDLFRRIDELLERGNYVIISLECQGGWHMYVVYAKNNGEYQAVTKGGECGRQTLCCNNVKQVVRGMNGTDILSYAAVGCGA